MYQGKSSIRTWRRMKRLLQARSLALEEEEIENRPQSFIKSYRSNEIAKPHQQPQIEKQLTKKTSLLIDLLATNNQPMPPISISKEEKLTFMLICNQGEFFMELKEVEQIIILEEAFTTVEISNEVDKPLEVYRGVRQDKFFEVLLPMEESQHHCNLFIMIS